MDNLMMMVAVLMIIIVNIRPLSEGKFHTPVGHLSQWWWKIWRWWWHWHIYHTMVTMLMMENLTMAKSFQHNLHFFTGLITLNRWCHIVKTKHTSVQWPHHTEPWAYLSYFFFVLLLFCLTYFCSVTSQHWTIGRENFCIYAINNVAIDITSHHNITQLTFVRWPHHIELWAEKTFEANISFLERAHSLIPGRWFIWI